MSIRLILISVSLAGHLATGHAQAASCEGVLSLAGRDNEMHIVRLSNIEEQHNAMCQGKQRRSGFNITAGVAAFVDGLPVELTGSGNSTADKVSNFCSRFDSWRQTEYQQLNMSSTVVREAVSAWTSCMALAKNEVIINVKPDVEQLVISLRRGSSDARFDGISLGSTAGSQAVKCSFLKVRNIGDSKHVDPTSASDLPVQRVLRSAGITIPQAALDELRQDAAANAGNKMVSISADGSRELVWAG